MAFSMKAAPMSNSSIATCCYIKTALFHSTPFLERRRRTNWDSGGGPSGASSKKNYNFSRRCRKMHSKHTLLRNVSEFAEHLFQNWRAEEDYSDPFSSKGSSWFRAEDWAKGKKKANSASQGPQWGDYRNRGGFHFCYGDDEDVEVIFRSAFGGERSTYWSFIDDDDDDNESFQGRSSSYKKKRKRSWNWRDRYEDGYDTYEEYNDNPEPDLASDRRALGLSASGPLKLEDVKKAYRACALKWHPDRHPGSAKASAEEKFKLCSAAYQSLCDKLE